ncbi:MAG: tRNA 2-selenouridine(34) synthase MnmH [Deltaproteobacteria bacterium]|nr:tRNA 2-selenouridine(34) synthase MnmH [Deltaproteobacteria bacterium]
MVCLNTTCRSRGPFYLKSDYLNLRHPSRETLEERNIYRNGESLHLKLLRGTHLPDYHTCDPEFTRRNILSVTAVFSEALIDSHFLVDARTPLEFDEDHIPGAVNVPLLNNDERVEIGILYKQQGPLQARLRGLEMTAARFPGMVKKIAEMAGNHPILVYCWRGGLRSKTVTSILDLSGFHAVQLLGGYKSYRAHVSGYFDQFRPSGPVVVLHGLTGSGKTAFLHTVQTNRYTVIDLEGLARHRGSAFGALGLSQSLSQKHFESILWNELRKSPPGRPILLEGESRRIGKISLPGNFYEVMSDSCKIWCETSMKTRIDRLIAEYGKEKYRDEMAAALVRIRKKLGEEKYREIAGYLESWDLRPFMKGLLDNYYDKVYYKTRDWKEDRILSLESYEEALRELDQFLLPGQA